LISTLQQERET